MKTQRIAQLLFFLFFCGAARSDPGTASDAEAAKSPFDKDKRKNLFIVATDDESASESLNRISGEYDLGFSSPAQSFESKDHYPASPYGREEAATKDR